MYRIMSSADRDDFRFSFPTYMPFIFLSYLLALDKNFLKLLDSSGESRLPCLSCSLTFGGFFSLLTIDYDINCKAFMNTHYHIKEFFFYS